MPSKAKENVPPSEADEPLPDSSRYDRADGIQGDPPGEGNAATIEYTGTPFPSITTVGGS